MILKTRHLDHEVDELDSFEMYGEKYALHYSLMSYINNRNRKTYEVTHVDTGLKIPAQSKYSSMQYDYGFFTKADAIRNAKEQIKKRGAKRMANIIECAKQNNSTHNA